MIRRSVSARAAALALAAVFALAGCAAGSGPAGRGAEPAGDSSAPADTSQQGAAAPDSAAPADTLQQGAEAPDGSALAESAEPDAGLAASADEELLLEYEEMGDSDPLEPSNRLMFGANETVYQFLFDPLADVYGFVVPRPVRRSVLHFFENLGEPAVFLNEVLQLNPERAGVTSVRFVVNTTVGVAGLFDPARRVGLKRNETDFGETLGVYGIGHGWYLVIPVLGPSSVRDLVGDLVNGFMHPQNYFLAYAPQAILATSSGFSRYEASRTELDALRDSSVDFYTAMRSAYLMQREAEVRAARADSPVLRRGDDDVAAAPTSVD